MTDTLDVMPVWVSNKGRKIVLMIVRPKAGRAVTHSTVRDSEFVELLHLVSAFHSERKMPRLIRLHAANDREHRILTIAKTNGNITELSIRFETKDSKHRFVKRPTSSDIADIDIDVIKRKHTVLQMLPTA